MKLLEHLIARNGVSVKIYYQKGITTLAIEDPFDERKDFRAELTTSQLQALIVVLRTAADKLDSVIEQEPDKPPRKSFFNDDVLPENYHVVQRKESQVNYSDENPKADQYNDRETEKQKVEREIINFMYQHYKGDIDKIAQELKMKPMDVRYKVRRLNIKLEPPVKEDDLPF
jgi:DNA-binding NtrC family response regulator